MLADTLNESGQSMGDGLLIRLPLRYTAEALHERVVHPYIDALWPGIDSTANLTTTEMQTLYRDLDQIIAERSGCSVAWPSIEPPMMEHLCE